MSVAVLTTGQRVRRRAIREIDVVVAVGRGENVQIVFPSAGAG